ncbi:MAG: diphosphomevalonate decarboxylase, partial [Limosilactobacillus fermentum]
YYTMDAGPNVKVIFDPKDQDDLLNALTPLFGAERLVVAKPGPGIEFLTEPVMKF